MSQKEKPELLEFTVRVGIPTKWSITIEKYCEGEPRIRFEGDPTVSEFAEAFKVLAKVEVANRIKELIDEVIANFEGKKK